MFKVTNWAGEEVASEETLPEAYQRARDYVVGHGRDAVVWHGDRISAIFAYDPPPTIVVKPERKYTIVMVTK